MRGLVTASNTFWPLPEHHVYEANDSQTFPSFCACLFFVSKVDAFAHLHRAACAHPILCNCMKRVLAVARTSIRISAIILYILMQFSLL